MKEDPTTGKLPIEGVDVGLFLLCEHHDCPDAPVEIVEHHAVLGLSHGGLALDLVRGPGGVLVL